MRPAPPKEIVMATGAADGSYHAHALKYRDFLEREGVSAAPSPLGGFDRESASVARSGRRGGRLPSCRAGSQLRRHAPEVVSLGSMYLEPLWLFHRGDTTVDTLGALRGKMVAVGAANSGTETLALTLLESSGIAKPPTTCSSSADVQRRTS